MFEVPLNCFSQIWGHTGACSAVKFERINLDTVVTASNQEFTVLAGRQTDGV